MNFCKEHGCEIAFKKQFGNIPVHVIVALNAWTKVASKDLVEVVNRLIEMRHTAPINYDKLDWWEEQKSFINR